MLTRSSWRWNIFLPHVIAGLLLISVSLVRADASKNVDLCERYDGLLLDNAKLNVSIQTKLSEIYQQSKCYQQYTQSDVNPLNDGVVGTMTKKWVNQALNDHHTECLEKAACADPASTKDLASAVEGLQPYVLLQNDLDKLKINRDAADIANQFVSNQPEDGFVAHKNLLDSVAQSLSEIENITDDMLNDFRNDIRKRIEVREVHGLTKNTIDTLIAQGLFEEAKALEPLVGKVKAPERLKKDITNILTVLLAEKNNAREEVESDGTASSPIKVNETVAIVSSSHASYNRYILKENDFAQEWQSINPDVANCMAHIVGVVYPSRGAMEASIHSILENLDQLNDSTVLSDPSAPSSDFACKIENVSEVNKFVELPDTDILLMYAGQGFFDEGLAEISLNVLSSCTDCALPMNQTNYGFYPYWQSSKHYNRLGLQSVNPSALDLSLFTRMAYFALPINDDGTISSFMHWSNESSNVQSFVEVLSKFNVKRDIVLYIKNWCHWGDLGAGSECRRFDSKAPHTSAQYVAEEYAKAHYKELKRLNESVKDVGGIDGVTLYFDDYTYELDASNIVTYVEALKDSMASGAGNSKAEQPLSLQINVLLGIKELESVEVGERVSSFEPNYFIKIRKLFIPNADNSWSPPVDKLLIFLNEDTSRNKKLLRTQIENEFSGVDRVTALHSVVPILTRAQHKESGTLAYAQYEDDIAYLKENFGGIGVWNLPLTGLDKDSNFLPINEQMEIFSDIMNDPERNHINYSKLGFMGEWLHSPVITANLSVCGYVCPYRKIYHRIFIFLICANLITELLWRTNCTVRTFIATFGQTHNFLRLSVVVLFFVLLGCDPKWQENSNAILFIPIVFMVILGLYFLFGRSYEKDI